MQGRDKYNILSSSCSSFSYAGYCSTCSSEHVFTGPECSAQAVIEELTRCRSLYPDSENDLLSTDALFGQSRGKMFGVMKCRNTDGGIIFLKAFSGQFNGLWQVEGWVPPLFDVPTWTQVNSPAEQAIKRLGEEMNSSPDSSAIRRTIQKKRKLLSRNLMKDLHSLYRLTNFRRQSCSLYDIFSGSAGIPTGTGDCCAPKLFNFAATHDLIPLAISEFFWGRENRSGTRKHGHFYPPCTEKCRPILGFMLCGLEAAHARHIS